VAEIADRRLKGVDRLRPVEFGRFFLSVPHGKVIGAKIIGQSNDHLFSP